MRNPLKLLFILCLVFIHNSVANAQEIPKTVVYKKATLSQTPVILKYQKPKPLKAAISTKARTVVASRNEKLVDKIIRKGMSALGTPYKYGSSGGGSFDCSGFTAFAYNAAAIELPHSSAAQATLGKHVDKSDLCEGDLIIFNNPANTKIGHVGIYIGNNNFIHASTSNGVTITSLASSYYAIRYVSARRIIE